MSQSMKIVFQVIPHVTQSTPQNKCMTTAHLHPAAVPKNKDIRPPLTLSNAPSSASRRARRLRSPWLLPASRMRAKRDTTYAGTCTQWYSAVHGVSHMLYGEGSGIRYACLNSQRQTNIDGAANIATAAYIHNNARQRAQPQHPTSTPQALHDIALLDRCSA